MDNTPHNATPLDAQGTIVTVYDMDGTALSIAPDEEREVIAALDVYARSGKTVDRLLEITSEAGGTYRTFASRIVSMFRSTSEQRARAVANGLRNFRERQEHRTEAGYVEPLSEADA